MTLREPFNGDYSSTAIQDIEQYASSNPKIATAYFYFDFKDSEKQYAEKLIRSLVIQLSACCPRMPSSLLLAYSQSQDGRRQPTIETFINVLYETLECFESVYILLDALDECKEREDLRFIRQLTDRKTNSLHLLATSRKENDIETTLQPLVTCQLCIQSKLVDADIRIHVIERLSNDPKLKKWPTNVKSEIEDILSEGAKGM